MIALMLVLNPATHMPCLGIGTGKERSIFLRDAIRPPDLEPIHQAQTRWKWFPPFPFGMRIATYPGIHPVSLGLPRNTRLMEVVHIMEVIAPELRLGRGLPVDTAGIIHRVIQERERCPLYTRRRGQKGHPRRLHTLADARTLYCCRACRQAT